MHCCCTAAAGRSRDDHAPIPSRHARRHRRRRAMSIDVPRAKPAAANAYRAHIMILGSGFAALTAIRRLRALGVDADITVVSPRRELVYLPSLVWVPSGAQGGDDLRVPLAAFFARMRVHWVEGSVQQVQDGGRRVVTDHGELANDVLVI